MVYRIFVEKQPAHAVEARSLFADIRENLMISSITSLRVLNRYDIEGISAEIFEKAKNTIFSEPQSDIIFDEPTFSAGDRIFAVEYLPGQFDQRADSCAQCVQLITYEDRPAVRTARVYILSGDVTEEELAKIKAYVINPVESREASLDKPETLAETFEIPTTVETIEGFISYNEDELAAFLKKYALAMDLDDVKFCQKYFVEEEKRDPTISEIRLIDSYWSDHCRHTTFLTAIDEVKIGDKFIEETYEDYIEKRKLVYGSRKKNITLMDMATIAGKYLKSIGALKNLDESEEINACSIKIKVDVDGEIQDWLLMFKNETHNHPTEIEPFGGAATCLGGAIRDPLSGRAYVYQAMRVTGCADPRVPVAETIPGKLPQSKITHGASAGYSSYGNQIGLATGAVYELYHPNYVAKHLEIGAVVGAAPEKNVVRERPEAGDVIILLGGKTGRDGCGGATGSSKAHTTESLTTCGAEVQKGNPPEERKIQRLFRDENVTRLIKRCNDFGAGGVSVAIGELADGLLIDLSKVPKKYEGLDGTELAISESQERMAVVVAAEDADKFRAYASRENLESTIVATVTEEARLRMLWNDKFIIDLSREFLNSNGAEKHTKIEITKVNTDGILDGYAASLDTADTEGALKALITDLNICSQRGLVEKFDSSIGAGTVVMPYGGKYQLTQPQYMAAKIPVLSGETDTTSVMAYGYDPFLSEKSPYHGALYAVVESVAKLVAAGIDYKTIYLTFQEYFERTNGKPERWGKPMAALLGSVKAQLELGIAAIGGKDSMSGTFENIDVPPTLVSFAIAPMDAKKIVTPEFKQAGDRVYLIKPAYNEDKLPDFASLRDVFDKVYAIASSGKAKAIYTVDAGGVAEGLMKMTFGNRVGFKSEGIDADTLFKLNYGAFIIETNETLDAELIGYTTGDGKLTIGDVSLAVTELSDAWEGTLEKVFPTKTPVIKAETVEAFTCTERAKAHHADTFAKPRVVIPVFPGTNCEYDTMRRFKAAGAEADIFVLRNLDAKALGDAVDEFVKLLDNAQMLMIPGGFSGGDEPDGSGKFITAVLRNPRVKDAVTRLLEERDGLALGICNGFQALVKSGLLPYGRIMDEMRADCPTLTFNTIGRHQSMMVRTRIASNKSPWLAGVNAGDIHSIPISHGEGRFYASEELIRSLAANGQIATQYVDMDGNPTMDIRYNPNGSMFAIEGILSPDGRILGKMGHSERIGRNVAVNIEGDKDQKIFESGVKYFK
ncbi:MAG: phosphoribosylformylglycinamidine synthase [Ruminococcaceae bacterium]|nr:phosphoribosylformylglycinamidine synthase [Oscillospiraceae bacterium]